MDTSKALRNHLSIATGLTYRPQGRGRGPGGRHPARRAVPCDGPHLTPHSPLRSAAYACPWHVVGVTGAPTRQTVSAGRRSASSTGEGLSVIVHVLHLHGCIRHAPSGSPASPSSSIAEDSSAVSVATGGHGPSPRHHPLLSTILLNPSGHGSCCVAPDVK